MHRNIQVTKKERGQSMVELALTITIIMVLLAGTIDMGRAFFTWLAMRDAAQEGASYGSIAPPSSNITCDSSTPSPGPQICQRIWDNLEQVVSIPRNSMVIDVDLTGPACFGSKILVNVRYPNFQLAMPFLATVLGSDTIPIRATINDTVLSPLCSP